MRLSKEKQAAVVEAYSQGASCKQVGRDFSISPQTVSNLLKRTGLSARADFRLPIHNETAFSCITPTSAYWAGFLLADGCIHFHLGRYPKVILELGIEDREHVEKFREFLQAEAGVKVSHKGAAARFEVTSQRLVSDLLSLGITERKSLTATVSPSLENNRDFWRGVIDGDGWLGYNSGNGRPHIGLIGTRATIESFQDFCGIEGTVGTQYKMSTAVYYSRKAAKVARVLYAETKLYLDRKKILADSIMEYRKEQL